MNLSMLRHLAIAVGVLCILFSTSTFLLAAEIVWTTQEQSQMTAGVGAPLLEHQISVRKPLCHSEGQYSTGRWMFDRSIGSFPYLSNDDYTWGPLCTKMQQAYLTRGIIPDFLKYKWQPDSCDMLTLDRDNFCRVFQDKTVGIIGDSMMQQFAHSMLGLILGKVESEKYFTPDWNLKVPLCPETEMTFVRWNKYQGKEEDHKVLDAIVEKSDYLIMNFGVHYQPWLEMENSTIDMIRHLEKYDWSKKKLFWRSTVVAHANCSSAVHPDPPTNETYHLHPYYNTGTLPCRFCRPFTHTSCLTCCRRDPCTRASYCPAIV